jgi:hypothetical protein
MSDTPSAASNIKNDYEESRIFLDRHSPESTKSCELTITKTGTTSTGFPINEKSLPPVINAGAIKRIGTKINKVIPVKKTFEDNGFESSGTRVGSVTVFGENQNISEFDSHRQGHGVKNLNHFGKKISPFASVNTDKFLNQDGTISHAAKEVNYGQDNLVSTRDEKGNLIPYKDLPGILSPSDYVRAGNYILGYPIVTDNIINYDKFKNPDTSNGVIEIFNVTRQFANNNIDDINIKGIRGDLITGDWNFDQKGSNIIDFKYEKIQDKYDFYEDSQDILIGGPVFKFKQGIVGDDNNNKTFTAEGFVSDGYYKIAPFNEIINQFLIANNVTLATTGSAYSYNRVQEKESSEIGTRYTSSNSGFIIQKINVGSNSSGIKNHLGVDSIAFGGLLK